MYPTDLYDNIYIDNIQKAVVICLIILTTFPDLLMLDPAWRQRNVLFFEDSASKGNIIIQVCRVLGDVNRFWSSRRKLKSSRQIDVDGAAVCRTSVPFTAGGLWGCSRPPRSCGINGAKSCILGLSWHLISLLKLHFFVLFFSYFQQLFKIKDPFVYYFWLYCGSDSGTSIF
jgi:hypothetical protein